jgi:hypothetical protein
MEGLFFGETKNKAFRSVRFFSLFEAKSVRSLRGMVITREKNAFWFIDFKIDLKKKFLIYGKDFEFFQMDSAFVKMHFRNFATEFSIFGNVFAIYGNAFIFKKNAKSIFGNEFLQK